MGDWLCYSELAWVDPILAPPEEFDEETRCYIALLRRYTTRELESLLHLGCGAGINDYAFKREFAVTGVDISPGMLEVARGLNPEVRYREGDMRTVRLDDRFDAVVIPDSISYMQNESELRQAFRTAYEHLNPGGVLLVVAHLREEFQDNNFVYTGSRDEIEVVQFENNYILDSEATQYEATFVFLIRRGGELDIYTDRHVLSLFSRSTFSERLAEWDLEVHEVAAPDLYGAYVMAGGEYPLRVFVATKALAAS